MKIPSLKYFVALLLCISFAKSDLLELTSENFNSTLAENQYVLVMYYDPFNSVCKRFMPKYKRLAQKMSNVIFARLNGEKEVDLADEQGVDDYPSFELFVWGVPIKYNRHDSITVLRKFVENRTSIEMRTASSTSDFSDRNFEVYYTTDDDNSLINRVLQGINKKHEDLPVYKLSSSFAQSLASELGVTIDSSNAIFSRRKHDNHVSVYSGDITPFELESWVVTNEYPFISNFGQRTIHWLNTEEIPVVIFFHDANTVNQTWVENLREQAKRGKGIALTVLADTNQNDVQEFATNNGITTFPSLIVFEPDTPYKRFLCRRRLKKIGKKTLLNCLHDYEARDLRRFYRSEEPVTETDRNVHYIVGSNFGKEIFSNFDRYSLVYFYNSTTADGVEGFKDFANRLSGLNKLRFAVFNMDQNEHRQVLHITPGSLLFFSPDDDNIADLVPTSLTAETILPFLEDHAPNKLFDQIHSALKGESS